MSPTMASNNNIVCEGFLSNMIDGKPHQCHHCGLHRESHEGEEQRSLERVPQPNQNESRLRFKRPPPTFFSNQQTEAMLQRATLVGWNLNNYRNHPEIQKFCDAIGVTKAQFRSWMHNHKERDN
ncbi:hypothetical protein QQ045_019044 [Rhodiola kirilowii]